ncbi:hypothetical protein G7Y89_g12689 [Cudoniella acicularis]|uniref:Uncharacterized protein n=1 Tax=Cudoniella acicularis TaxID=354080 RepID=A0A8H4R9L6_9HELO|nr:hypothetical protein G7Y89_g12689 [Cudoniella acicularis]
MTQSSHPRLRKKEAGTISSSTQEISSFLRIKHPVHHIVLFHKIITRHIDLLALCLNLLPPPIPIPIPKPNNTTKKAPEDDARYQALIEKAEAQKAALLTEVKADELKIRQLNSVNMEGELVALHGWYEMRIEEIDESLEKALRELGNALATATPPTWTLDSV